MTVQLRRKSAPNNFSGYVSSQRFSSNFRTRTDSALPDCLTAVRCDRGASSQRRLGWQFAGKFCVSWLEDCGENGTVNRRRQAHAFLTVPDSPRFFPPPRPAPTRRTPEPGTQLPHRRSVRTFPAGVPQASSSWRLVLIAVVLVGGYALSRFTRPPAGPPPGGVDPATALPQAVYVRERQWNDAVRTAVRGAAGVAASLIAVAPP